MVELHDDNLRGSRFFNVDLSGSRLHNVVLQDVKITGAWIDNLDISAHVGRLVVNDVDVSDFVSDELDRRHPERRLLRATDSASLGAAWTVIEEQAAATLQMARTLPEAALDESVDGEFSYLQTLRHLVFATDRWLTGPVFADAEPFHPLGQPHDGALEPRHHGFLLDARPTLDEVLEVRGERMARTAAFMAAASEADLQRIVDSPNGGTVSVAYCIQVVLFEEWAHNRYAIRDLEILRERGGSAGG